MKLTAGRAFRIVCLPHGSGVPVAVEVAEWTMDPAEQSLSVSLSAMRKMPRFRRATERAVSVAVRRLDRRCGSGNRRSRSACRRDDLAALAFPTVQFTRTAF